MVLLNNTVDGLKSFGLVIGASVYGLFIGTMNSININGNTIKNIENVGTLFTLMTGIYVTSAPAISQTIINNNIVDNVSANFSANGSTNVTGIHVNGFFNVSNNTIKNVSGFCLNNYINGLSIQSNLNVTNTVSKNLIFNITNQNTSSTFNSIISGITSSLSGGNALIEKNVIYGLKNLSQNATSKVIGFYNPNFGNYTFSNNMISISNSNLTNDIECYGVLDYGNVNGVSDRNFYHNSIYVSGNSIGTNATSAVLLYRTLTTNVTNVINNILEMRRTGGSKNYTISNPTSNSLSNFNCNYNILNNINSNQIALYNSTDYTFANWQTTTTKDTNSFTNQNINYTNPAIADLHLNLSCGSSGLTGTNIGILTDIDNQPRIVATPTIGADENAGNSTTWNGTSWNNGTPTLTSTVIIAGNYDMTLGATRPSIDACSLDLNSGTVTISSGKYINIQNNLTIANSASLNVLDKGSLVQINDLGTNTINGTFTVARAVNQNITRLDYVYWSSPVANFPIANVSITTTSNKIWEWTPYGNLINSPTFGTGNWLNASGNMTVGKGYIIRGPSTSLTPMPFSATFFGTPNNGINTPSISRGTYNSGTYFGTNGRPITNADDNWNLVGNPYPSAIKTLDFLALNPNIEGAIRLWTHGTPLSTANPNPFYNSYAANYAVSDYITYNGTGTTSGPLGFNGFIASGQSFFVNMNETTGSAFETIIFKNSLRSSGYDNSQFYKTNPVASTNQGRIWLNLVSNSTNEVSKILVGYVPIATNQKDRMFDALNVYGGSQTFSSLINNDMMIIQGRALPFDNQDIVPLAVEVVTAGNFSIAISEIDGLFSDVNQPIFLQDNLLNITHDLRQAPYQFNSLVGDYKNRFVMKYTNVASNAPGFNTLLNALNITSKDQTITIFSNTEKINAIEIYDILGRKLFETNNINDRSFSISNLAISTQSLIFKIKLESGELITRKVVL